MVILPHCCVIVKDALAFFREYGLALRGQDQEKVVFFIAKINLLVDLRGLVLFLDNRPRIIQERIDLGLFLWLCGYLLVLNIVDFVLGAAGGSGGRVEEVILMAICQIERGVNEMLMAEG